MAFGLSGLARQQRRTGKFTQRHKASLSRQTTKLPQLKPVLLLQFDDSKFKKLRPPSGGKGATAKSPPPR
jgi:hypothetical protein